jgi:hypothetical protein
MECCAAHLEQSGLARAAGLEGLDQGVSEAEEAAGPAEDDTLAPDRAQRGSGMPAVLEVLFIASPVSVAVAGIWEISFVTLSNQCAVSFAALSWHCPIIVGGIFMTLHRVYFVTLSLTLAQFSIGSAKV